MADAEVPEDSSLVVRNASFTSAIELYLDANPWVSDDHTPYVTALYKLAHTLDYASKLSAAMVMEYRQNFKELRACQPEHQGDDIDPFDKALAEIVNGGQ